MRDFHPSPGLHAACRPSLVIRRLALVVMAACVMPSVVLAEPPFAEPLVARVEMKLAVGEEIVDVIEQGDLLTVLEEREDDYVIVTHDGSRGAIDKVNAVRIAESGDIYTDLIQRHPNEGRYYTLRASSWWALGKTEKALEDFDRAIELGYTEAHAYTSRGLFHAEMGNFDEAIADYNEALEIDPEDLAPMINRAAVYMSQGKFQQAADDYTRVLEEREGKESVSLLHQRAIARKAAGKLDDAVADFEAILDIAPDDYVAIMGRGYIRFQQQQHDQAIADFSKAIELSPEDAVAYNNRGYNRHQVGDLAAALEDYDRAIELAPKYALALQNRAWLLATAEDENIRDAEAAIASAEEACELTNYERVGDLSALAAALASAGRFEDAIGWQEKVVERVSDPFKEFARKTLARYENHRPFAADPDKADAEERAAAQREAQTKQQAESDPEAGHSDELAGL